MLEKTQQREVHWNSRWEENITRAMSLSRGEHTEHTRQVEGLAIAGTMGRSPVGSGKNGYGKQHGASPTKLVCDPAIPLLGICPKELKSESQRDICMLTFISIIWSIWTVNSSKQRVKWRFPGAGEWGRGRADVQWLWSFSYADEVLDTCCIT